jgi:hypothetical protein
MAAAEELVVMMGNSSLEAGGYSGVGVFTLPVAEWPKTAAGGVREGGPALVGRVRKKSGGSQGHAVQPLPMNTPPETLHVWMRLS